MILIIKNKKDYKMLNKSAWIGTDQNKWKRKIVMEWKQQKVKTSPKERKSLIIK